MSDLDRLCICRVFILSGLALARDDFPPVWYMEPKPFELLWHTCTCTSLFGHYNHVYCADIGIGMHERGERERRRERGGRGYTSTAPIDIIL